MDTRPDDLVKIKDRRKEVEVPKVIRGARMGRAPVGQQVVITSYSAQNKSESEIRSDIERTRAEMSETVDGIQEHINPQRLRREAQQAVEEATVGRAKQMANRVRSRADEVRQDFMDAIRENPIPAGMIALGLGWLIRDAMGQDRIRVPELRQSPRGAQEATRYMERRAGYAASQAQERAGEMAGRTRERAGEMAGMAQERVGRTMEQARSTMEETQDRASEMMEQAQERAGEVLEQAQQRVRSTTSQLGQFVEDNPLAAGAIALALGAAIGLTVPETRQERHLMGETRDTLVDRAQEFAQERIGEVEKAVRGVEDLTTRAQPRAKPQENDGPEVR